MVSTRGKADLHMHSTYSDGWHTIEEILEHVERHTDLDVIAVTDHDCLEGGLRAQDLAAHHPAQFEVEVIPGAEISTQDGHLLALNIHELIESGLSMAETIQAVHEQGGLAVVAHPLSLWCPSASLAVLESLAGLPAECHPDGLEVYNASFAGIASNGRVRTLNRRLGWAETGGSDAHTLNAIASSYTSFPGTTALDLLSALRSRQTEASGGYWSALTFVNFGYRSLRYSNRMTEATGADV